MNEPVNPAFFTEFDKYKRIVEKYGEDSEQAINQFMKVFDDGNPLYNVADLAKHFGLSESEVIADIERMNLTPHTGNINRIQ